MITITLNQKKYKSCYSWKDVTLERYCRLASIPMPEGYEAFILADTKFSIDNIQQYIDEVAKLTEEQISLFPAYYRKVIGVMTNIPDSVELSYGEINDLYDYHFKPFVLSLLYYRPVIHFMGTIQDYTPDRINKLRIGRHVFRLPGSVRIGIPNEKTGEAFQDIPLFNEPIITYSEAMDVVGGTRITRNEVKRLSMFMSIYCRKWYDRSYSEKRSIRRQDLFMRAPMSVVWSVFFYTVMRLPDCRLIFRLFSKLPKPASEVVEAARTFRALGIAGSYLKLPITED